MFMRAIIGLTALALCLGVPAYAEPKNRDILKPITQDQHHRLTDEEMEEHAEQALQRQDMRAKKLDEQTKKATNTICVGCAPSPPAWVLERPKRPARPLTVSH